MHRRYEPLKSQNNRMQGQIDPVQAERLMGELARMFSHILDEDLALKAKSDQPANSDVTGAAPGAVSRPN